jgi:hypothetical protein
MKIKQCLSIAILCIFFIPAIAIPKEFTINVKQNRASIRKGPGSFYEVIATVHKDAKLNATADTGSGWIKVRFQKRVGFISEKVTRKTESHKDVFSQMAFQPAALKLSRHGMSAGAKGFAMRFAKRINGNHQMIDQFRDFKLDPEAYRQFRDETYKNQNVTQLRKRFPIPENDVRSDFSMLEEGIGLGIASKIGTLKLYNNKPVTDYINFVGNLLVEASPAYDLSFKFFVIDQPFVNAYACPSGYVFISKGLLQLIKNEGELAVVLGHEIAHIVYQHGMQELEKRKPIIIAEDAFSQLDTQLPQEKDDEFKKIESELDDFALAVYETIFSGRLSQYELEADQFGLIFAARCGYHPGSMADLLERMIKSKSLSSNDHYTQEQIKNRLNHVKKTLRSGRWKGNFHDFEKRWQTYAAQLK